MIEKELIEFLIEAKNKHMLTQMHQKKLLQDLVHMIMNIVMENLRIMTHILVELNLWEKKLYMMMILHHFGE